MSRRPARLSFLIAVFVSCYVADARADTGRIVIYRVPPVHRWPPLPPPPPPIQSWNQNQVQNVTQVGSGNTNVNDVKNTTLLNQNLGTQILINGTMVPNPATVAPAQFSAVGKGFSFNEPRQNGVIAWNGKQQILILSTDESNNIEGGGATLSILPLPGKPISVRPASTQAFDDAMTLVKQRLNMVAKGTMLLEAKIGTHNIFVWELDRPEDFAGQVRSYIKEKYNGVADAVITPEAEQTVKYYFDQGFRYFAFDLAFMPDQRETKVAIAYRFESPYVYYPLVISRIGGVGATQVNLVVFSPSALHHFKGLAHERIEVFGNRTIDLVGDDIRGIDAEMAELMGDQPFKGRIFEIAGQLNEFDGDLMAW
jgi:hypothetical protein